MEKFKFEIDVRPEEIPNLDDAHKRDCSDAVKKAIGGVFKYTLIFAAAAAVFYVLYVFFGFLWLLRMKTLLPQMSALIPLTAAVIFLVELAAGTMNKFAIVLEILLLGFIAVLAAMVPASMIIVPFALYGLVRHIQLIALIPFYRVLSSLPGYPDFTPLPTADEVHKQTGNSEMQKGNANTVEGNDNMSGNENGNEGNISPKTKETTVLPQETAVAETSDTKENVQEKKRKRKNRSKKRNGK